MSIVNNIDLSIVIPVYNSEKNLEILINQLIVSLKKNYDRYEIILVDDESKDKSWNVIKNICLKYDFIRGIQLRKNVGQHNAIFAGLKYTNGNFIITMDDDGQNSPEDIKLLVDKVKNGYDVSYANYKNKKHNITLNKRRYYFIKTFSKKINIVRFKIKPPIIFSVLSK